MKSILRIIKFTGALWPYYLAVAGFSILVAATQQVQPLLIRNVLDEMTKLVGGETANIKLIVIFAVLIFAADVGHTLFDNIGGYFGDQLGAKLRRLMSYRYFSHLLKLPQAYFDTELSGKILNRLNRGVDQIANFIQGISNNFLQMILGTVVSLTIVYIFSWQVGVMLTLLYPIFILLTTSTSKRWMVYQKKINHHYDIATGRFAEAINQIKVVKSFRRSKSELSLFNDNYHTAVQTTRPQSSFWHRRNAYRQLSLNVIFLAVYMYVFVATAQGQYTIGTMVLLIMYANNIRMPLFGISYIVDMTQRAIANSVDYFEVIDTKPSLVDAQQAKPLAVPKGEIAFNSVYFNYDESSPVLKGLSFKLTPHSKTALIGESGAGKTTITSILLRLYDIDSGTVTIDGQPLDSVTQDSLHAAIGVVFQEPALFSGTIFENIAYGRPEATMQEVEAAAKSANAHAFIASFEKGYDSEIGERGLKLSGGQKQRIAIARAILKDAPILILDEATSSLDTKSEKDVQQALERLMKNRTTLIIAHRLSTIQTVDQIITLSDGKVNETGTPAELAVSGGIYQELLRLQDMHTSSSQERIKSFGINQ